MNIQQVEQFGKPGLIQRKIRKLYVRWIRPRISKEINKQRLKLIWDIAGYRSLLSIKSLPLADKLQLLRKFLVIDWYVVHAHKPSEISLICQALAEHPAKLGEAFVEAGCWQGGSSAKFSIICKLLGYSLHIYDSFQGVEQMQAEAKASSYDFSGEYASPERVLRENLARYGNKEICFIHKGWFAETLALGLVPNDVRIAYIDCDLAKGTKEALTGIVPVLVDDGWIFSQDFHIKPVQKLLCDASIWQGFGKGTPTVTRLGGFLASIRLNK